MEKNDVIKYVQTQIATTKERLQVHTHNTNLNGRAYPKRHVYVLLKKYISDFERKEANSRFIIISGLRGVGKTTVISQICSELLNRKNDNQKILYLSMIEPARVLNFTLSDILTAYEAIIGDVLERTKKQIFIFLDEVQKDPNWAVTLHALFEKNNNIFICCTGSSAVLLQANADVARRARFEKLPPLSFPEYQMLKKGVYPTAGLKNDLRVATYGAKTAKATHALIEVQQSKIRSYWSNIVRTDVDHFLRVGTMPFSLIYKNDEEIFDAISYMLDNVITKDLSEFGRFDSDTLGSVKRLLFILAGNDTTSIHKLEEILGLKRVTIQNLLDALEKTEILIRIPAYGSATSVARKPAKYLFMSPAIRMTFLRMAGNADTFLVNRGKLLEDIVGAHLFREIAIRGKGQIRYDSTHGGADFIVNIGEDKRIAIEVGSGKKEASQVIKTMNDKKCDYGIVFAKNDLLLDEKNNIVFVPFETMLLM